MAVKEWFKKLQPVQVYLVLSLTITFFSCEIVVFYFTHALTLLLNAYHMLCNIVALCGCVASIKYRKKDHISRLEISNDSSIDNSATCENTVENGADNDEVNRKEESSPEKRMKNTFGWARIDILTMLACCIFTASFCFSLCVESLQTLIHIDHQDAMHKPLLIMCLGAAGLLLNGLCYLLIGGYTFNQEVCLHVTPSGDVILRRRAKSKPVGDGKKRLTTPNRSPLVMPKTQGILEASRDILSCVLVIVASVLVYLLDENPMAKFVDPIVAMISATCLFSLSYPYMKDSSMILLQTIPNHINIVSLKKDVLAAFPGILNVHDFHVWQLTGQNVISTVHIIFLSPEVYGQIIEQLKAYFLEMGITQVTIQPEFYKVGSKIRDADCLYECRAENCKFSQCCSKTNTSEDCGPCESEEQQQSVDEKSREENVSHCESVENPSSPFKKEINDMEKTLISFRSLRNEEHTIQIEMNEMEVLEKNTNETVTALKKSDET